MSTVLIGGAGGRRNVMLDRVVCRAANSSVFTARCTYAKRGIEIACRLSVCLSVDQDHGSWKSWKLTARTISPTTSIFVTQRSST